MRRFENNLDSRFIQPNNEKPKVLAIIPARGGSKGIPRKNICLLNGRPLISYTIEVALKAGCFDRVVVSTDDPEIALTAQKWGAETPFLRPKELAGDTNLIDETIKHILSRFQTEGYAPDYVAMLYPTHPFRTPSLVNYLTLKLLKGHDTVFTARRIQFDPLRMLVENEDGCLQPLSTLPHEGQCQEGRPYFRSIGTYIGSAVNYPQKLGYMHVIEDPIMLIDIDENEDLEIAEHVIANGLFIWNASEVPTCEF